MSDELTFLRWCYHNANRFLVTDPTKLRVVTDHDALRAGYLAETGNKVPADYQVNA